MKKLVFILFTLVPLLASSQVYTISKEASVLDASDLRAYRTRDKINTAVETSGSLYRVKYTGAQVIAGDTATLFTLDADEMGAIIEAYLLFDYADDSTFVAGTDSINVYGTSNGSVAQFFVIDTTYMTDTLDAAYVISPTTTSTFDPGSTAYLSIPATAYSAGNSNIIIEFIFRKWKY